MAGRRRAAAFALVLTTLALLVARGSAPRRTDLLDAPFVQLADADADAQEDGSDAVSEGEGSNVRFLPYLPRKLSKGTKKKMATMDRMVLGWNAKKDPAEFARDYSSDTDRVAGEAAQDAVADMERQQHEEVRYAGQKWPSGLPHHFGRPNLALARMEEEANEARETAIQASKRAGGDPDEVVEKAPNDLRWMEAARIANWAEAGEATAETRAVLQDPEIAGEPGAVEEIIYPKDEYPTYEDALEARAAQIEDA